MPASSVAQPLDAVGHLLAEMRRLDLILWIHVHDSGRSDVPSGIALASSQNDTPHALLERHIDELNTAIAIAHEIGRGGQRGDAAADQPAAEVGTRLGGR